ncbi:hypothetical protein NC77_21890 [Janthinobacterium lividum]|uniref:HNH endonuclease n=1 Tax=Janthinobacterium lividum TaxID=29581 RepID=UPI000537C8E3|nr:HNH endonuclease [Janthinobacterium lividum]KHA76765.1 hypothetical protein NC77_21890 [Janthinobacterium lividum]
MIKLKRQPEPQVIKDNGAVWLLELESAIATHGTLKNIPENEKSKLMAHYRHADIKEALRLSSNGKCAFCECIPEGGYLEVEHFKPSSIYHQFTFVWDNLLPACAQCNGLKKAHDTVLEPIINPYEISAIHCFEYNSMRVKPIVGPSYDVAERTIIVCGLDGVRLWKPRADILMALYGFTDSIKISMEEINDADTERKKVIRVRKLKEAIITIETLAQPGSKFSGFCLAYLRSCTEYIEAKRIIAASDQA